MNRRNHCRLALCASCSLRCCVSRSGAAAEESPADRISIESRIRLLSPPVSRHSGKVCASLATSREKTSSLSTDMRRESRAAP